VKRRQAVAFATTLIACVGCDHATKQLAQETLGGARDVRLAAGTVTDFARLQLGPLSTGVFNVADVAIVAGVLILLLVSRPASRAAPGSAA
jgi:hypothetical protein